MTATVEIDASAAATWHALTDPNKMKIWMADDEIEVKTDWQIGHWALVNLKRYLEEQATTPIKPR